MRVCFVTKGNSSRASYRYHNEMPANALMLRGHQAIVNDYPLPECDTFVFSKHFNYGDQWYVKALKAEGRKTVFHCCDNHFNNQHSEHYMKMISLADTVIAPTEEMARIIYEKTCRESVVIPDFYEYPLVEPSYKQITGPLKVMWFGQGCNIGNLETILPLPQWCELRLCTIFPQGIGVPKVLDKVPYMQWSYDNMLTAFKWCDVVILPLEDSEVNKTKSANRIVESTRQGKFVIASPIPSYLPFKEFMYVGDILEGLKWFKDQWHAEINLRIKQAQDYVEENHSKEVIGHLWEKALQCL